MPQLFSDDFTGTTGALLRQRGGWSYVGLALYQDRGTISGNRVRVGGGSGASVHYGYVRDMGDTAHWIEAKLLRTQFVGACLYARFADEQNFIAVRNSGTSLELIKRVGGTVTSVAAVATGLVSGDTVRLEVQGSTARLFKNGAQIGAVAGYAIADAALQNATRVGLGGEGNAGAQEYFDDAAGGNFAAATVTLTALAARRVVQRAAGAASRTMTMSGTYGGGTPAGLQWRLLEELAPGVFTTVAGFDWQALSGASIGGGAWSATVTIPQGGWYQRAVRWSDQQAVAAQDSTKFAVGAVVVIDGQSNAVGMGSYPGAVADDRASRFDGSGWALPTGAGEVALTGALVAALGVPVGVTNTGVGATAIGSHVPGTANWTAKMARLAGMGGDVEAVLWSQGESDGGILTTANYKSSLGAMFDEWKVQTGRSGAGAFRFLIGVTGRSPGGTTGTDAGWATVRQAQVEWADATAGAVVSHHAIDLSMADSLHYDGAGYAEAGARFARSYAAALGLNAVSARGPVVLSAEAGVRVVTVTLGANGASGFAGGFAGGAALSGWQVSADDFATLLPLAGAVLDNGRVRLTLGVDAPGPVKLRHLWGRAPDVSDVVRGTLT